MANPPNKKSGKSAPDSKVQEAIIDYSPDDMEAGEDNPGFKRIKDKLVQLEKERDLNPDDFE